MAARSQTCDTLPTLYRRHASTLHLQAGPLSKHLSAIATDLSDAGYAQRYLHQKVRHLRRFDAWLVKHRFRISDVAEDTVDRFLSERRRSGVDRRDPGAPATLATILAVLRRDHVIAPQRRRGPMSKTECIVTEFAAYLKNERGFAATSADRYLGIVRQFCLARFSTGAFAADRLGPRDAARFILSRAQRFSASEVSLTASALKAFFRFLFLRGRVRIDLEPSVPMVPSRRFEKTPAFLLPEEVCKLTRVGTGRKSPLASRDRALILVLARCGVRASEAAALTLDDVLWREGRIRIPGAKGAPTAEYPLDCELGQALAEYVRHARPRCSTRRLFVRTPAPHTAIRGSVVGKIVRRAIERVGLHPHRKGAHLLRHSLAVDLRAKGASLFEVADVLRHKHLDSTRIYARADFRSLRSVVQPWPFGAK